MLVRLASLFLLNWSAIFGIICQFHSSTSLASIPRKSYGSPSIVASARARQQRPRGLQWQPNRHLCSSYSRATIIRRASSEELYLSEENVELVLAECKENLATIFGNTAENRNVGITGDVELVDLEGPTVIVSLKGRFWHQRETVLARVAAFLQERIPEIVSVEVSDESMLLETNNHDSPHVGTTDDGYDSSFGF